MSKLEKGLYFDKDAFRADLKKEMQQAYFFSPNWKRIQVLINIYCSELSQPLLFEEGSLAVTGSIIRRIIQACLFFPIILIESIVQGILYVDFYLKTVSVIITAIIPALFLLPLACILQMILEMDKEKMDDRDHDQNPFYEPFIDMFIWKPIPIQKREDITTAMIHSDAEEIEQKIYSPS